MEGYVQQAKDRLLKAISKHDGKWGWYQLERLLDHRKLPDGVSLTTLLGEMESDSIIVRRGLASNGMQTYGTDASTN